MNDYTITGSRRIVKEELQRLLDAGGKVSVSILARKTGYTEQTVRRALVQSHEWGLVRYQCKHNGCRASYEVLE